MQRSLIVSDGEHYFQKLLLEDAGVTLGSYQVTSFSSSAGNLKILNYDHLPVWLSIF